eukprot:PITA_28092
MSFKGLRLEYALEGRLNYIAWKDRMEVVLDDNGLKEFIDAEVPKPTDAAQDSVNGREKLPGWERLWSDLVQEEIRRRTRDSSSSMHDEENYALASKAKKGKGKVSLFESSASNDGKKVGKSKVRCFRCHELGHYATNCPKKKSKKGSEEGSEGKKQDMSKVKCFHCHQHGHYATNCLQKKKNKQAAGSAVGEDLALQFELDFSLIACLVSIVMGSVWFLDSGAPFHMTGDRDLFSDLDKKDLGVHIEMGDGDRYSATSIGTISFERESSKPFILKEVMHVPGLKKNIISVAMLEDKGYDVVFSEGKAFLCSKTTGETRRIGVRVKNLYQLDVDGCTTMACKAEGVKSETYSKFCEFKALVEKELRKKVKALRSDNGGEFISGEFKDFCSTEGIRRELIAPHNPQQNGVAERKNRMIVGAARAMLHDQGLPLHLWAEACNTAVYVQDHCPHKILGMSTPEEAYSGKRPDISHLRIFGSPVYMHVTKDARKKLDLIAEVGIFVGYTDTPHNYRVYFPYSRKTVVRWDIKF